jgi:hypothetical protein
MEQLSDCNWQGARLPWFGIHAAAITASALEMDKHLSGTGLKFG